MHEYETEDSSTLVSMPDKHVEGPLVIVSNTYTGKGNTGQIIQQGARQDAVHVRSYSMLERTGA